LTSLTLPASLSAFCSSTVSQVKPILDDRLASSYTSSTPSSSPSADHGFHDIVNFLRSSLISLDSITLLLLNARSLLPKWHHLQAICAIASPTFICITETWLNRATQDSAISLPGYTLHRNDRCGAIGGGCAIYSKLDVQAAPILDSDLLDFPDSVWISTTQTSPALLLGCIYSPPAPSNTVLDNLVHIFSVAHREPFDCKLIVGDFNLPEMSWGSYSAPPRFSTLCMQLHVDGWIQNVAHPTRLNNILDLVLTNGPISASTAVGPHFPGSDHKIVFCKVECTRTVSAPHLLTYHSLTPDILSAFSSLIRSTDWSEFFLATEVQRAADLFYDRALALLSLVSPPKTRSLNSPNISISALKLRCKINRLRNQYLRTHDLSLLLSLQRLMATHSSMKTAHEIEQERNAFTHPLRSRKLTNVFRNRCLISSECIPCVRLEDGTSIVQPAAISQIFNTYFASCYQPAPLLPPLCRPSVSPRTSYLDHTSSLSNPNLLSYVPITLSKVITQIRHLKESSVPGPDKLPPSLVKYGGSDLPTLLLSLFSISLELGIVPAQWKRSVVTPRLKSGPRTAVQSYRGIHHTCHLLRILERLIKEPLLGHLLENDFIDKSQYGFLAKRSVASCQTHFLNALACANNNGESAIIIYLDIRKAFDQVPHSRLLDKLAFAGISGPLYLWFTSYFSNRDQTTLVSGSLSPPLPVTSGVIQGSVLGPILFILYINDIFKCIKNGTAFMFADDIKIAYFIPRGAQDCWLHRIQKDLDALSLWSTNSQLEFSPSKCLALHLWCSPSKTALTLCGNSIPVADRTTDLGIRYSCSLNFTNQALYQVAKARQISYLILRSFHLETTKLALFKQRVRPILEYCAFMASLLTKRCRLAIEGVQRRFTRLLLPPGCLTNYRERCGVFRLDPLWLRRLKLN
jgi:hypothetical protein